MDFSIITIIIILSLILITQVIILFTQYKLNSGFKGIEYWLLGSGLMSLAFIMMPLITIKQLMKYAIIANPLLILGYLCLYIGIVKFPDKKANHFVSIIIFIAFNILYYYFMFVYNNINARAVVICFAIAVISFMIAHELFVKKDKSISSSSKFLAIVFLFYGSANLTRLFLILFLPPANLDFDQGYILIASFVFSILVSNLWTFGFVIMINQKLTVENQLEKEKFQLIFDTNVNAQLIARLNDSVIIDINKAFTKLSGYQKADIVGNQTTVANGWSSQKDRQIFLEELKAKKLSKNREFVFKRKDGSEFTGTISSNIITIASEPHILSVVNDISERKSIELQMQKLLVQLELEKKAAQFNAITDSLTTLYNRGHFDATVRKEFARSKQSGSILSLIMLDIDNYKEFNDNYGHIAGDKCLQMISNVLKTTVERACDTVARYGGEEFIIILPETDDKGAILLAERIRKGVEDLAIPHKTSKASKFVTVSLGIISVYPSKLNSSDQMLKRVDEALYQAKENGRNCYVYKSN